MDYEKAYKDALERAKYWANNPTVWSSDDICQKLFPKIVEKKDESIKSCIGMCLTDVDNQRFENRCMYVAAMYMYKWVKKRAIKIVLDYLYSKVEDDKTSIEQEIVEEIKQKLKKEL